MHTPLAKHAAATAATTLGDMLAAAERNEVFEALFKQAGEADDDTGHLFTTSGTVIKVDADKRLVYGWASVVEENGRTVVDKHGDIIEPEELVKAAQGFMKQSRAALVMHGGEQVGDVVESLVFTHDVQKALGINLNKVGWFICMKIASDDAWAKFKAGDYKAFSIGGRATVEELD